MQHVDLAYTSLPITVVTPAHSIAMDLRHEHRFNPFSPSAEHQAMLDSAPDMGLDGLDYSDPSTIASLTGMPAPPTMEPAGLQRRARDMSKDIFHNHGLLQEIRE